MITVKDLLLTLEQNSELSTRLTSLDVIVTRFQYQQTNESDWARIGEDRLLKSRRLAVVSSTSDGRFVYDLLRNQFPDRVAIDIVASAGLAEDQGDNMPTKLLFEYLSVAKKPAIFRTPLSKDYGSVAGPNEVFTLICISSLVRIAELSISDGEGLEDHDLKSLFLNRVDVYVDYCHAVLKLIDGRYGKFYVCVFVDGNQEGMIPVLRPDVVGIALMDSLNLQGALIDVGGDERITDDRGGDEVLSDSLQDN